MSKWQYKLDLKESREQYEKDDNLFALCAAHVVKIKELIELVRKDHRKTIREMADSLENDVLPYFEEIAENPDSEYDVEDYDSALTNLYDWADTPLDRNWAGMKMCWVETF